MLKQESDIEEKFLPIGQKCLNASSIAYNENQIDEFIEKNIKEQFDVSGKSIRLQQLISINYPNAAKVALKKVFEA